MNAAANYNISSLPLSTDFNSLVLELYLGLRDFEFKFPAKTNSKKDCKLRLVYNLVRRNA